MNQFKIENLEFLLQDFFKNAIDDMASRSLRCVAIAYRPCNKESVPADEDLQKWELPDEDLVLLAIVGIKVGFWSTTPHFVVVLWILDFYFYYGFGCWLYVPICMSRILVVQVSWMLSDYAQKLVLRHVFSLASSYSRISVTVPSNIFMWIEKWIQENLHW